MPIFITIMLNMILFSYSPKVISNPFKGKTLEICGDGAEWPPFHFYKRVNGKKTKEVVGLTIDVLNRILPEAGIKATYKLPPWGRCLKEVEMGRNWVVALDSSYNAERDAKFLFTKVHHYSITPKLFLRKETYEKEKLNITTIGDIFKSMTLKSVCGLRGYNYEAFAPGIKKELIVQKFKHFDQLTKVLLQKRRCNSFLARYEILVGFKSLGQDYLHEGKIKAIDIPNSKVDKFYFLISKKLKGSEELRKIIDEGVTKLRNSGELDKMLKKYVD